MSALEQSQRQLASHIRNPEKVAGPAGVEPRRLKIYSDLFYNNIEGFLSTGFPVLRDIFEEKAWHAMVRDFMVKHRCHTPYFLEIAQEFLLYLKDSRNPEPNDPPFMEELAHYEWVELALDVAEQDIEADAGINREGDLLEQVPVVSPLAWSLAYRYPVHRIGPSSQPQQPPEQPTYLVVYRNREDQVEFMEANAITARLLELLNSASLSGRAALLQLAEEMQHPQPEQIVASGSDILRQLRGLDILLGTVALDKNR